MVFEYVKIPADTLSDNRLNDGEKIILGIICSLQKHGCKLSNAKIADMTGKAASTVNRIINSLRSKGYCTIRHSQSKYRTILLAHKQSSSGDSTCSSARSTCSFAPTYLITDEQHNKKNKNNESGTRSRKTSGCHEGIPTPEMVAQYAESIGYPELDGKHFCNYYAATGWQKNGSSIKDWKAVVRIWKNLDRNRQADGAKTDQQTIAMANEMANQLTREATDEDIAKLEASGIFGGNYE